MGELDYTSICFLILVFIELKIKQRNWTTLHKFHIFIKKIIIISVCMCIHYLTHINLCKNSSYKPHMSTFSCLRFYFISQISYYHSTHYIYHTFIVSKITNLNMYQVKTLSTHLNSISIIKWLPIVVLHVI